MKSRSNHAPLYARYLMILIITYRNITKLQRKRDSWLARMWPAFYRKERVSYLHGILRFSDLIPLTSLLYKVDQFRARMLPGIHIAVKKDHPWTATDLPDIKEIPHSGSFSFHLTTLPGKISIRVFLHIPKKKYVPELSSWGHRSWSGYQFLYNRMAY